MLKDETYGCACHECAHGVVRAVTGNSFVRLELDEGAHGDGRCVVEHVPIPASDVPQEILAKLAGFAFAKLLRFDASEDEGDFIDAECLCQAIWPDNAENLDRLLVHARDILLEHWDWVVRAGERLAERGTLSFEEFMELKPTAVGAVAGSAQEEA
jgi:hypothetical protein